MSVGSDMAGMAANAVRDAEGLFGVELDYTADTLVVLDSVIVRLQTAARALDGEQRKHLVNMSTLKFGAYLGEVVRRECGGIWVLDVAGAPENMPVVSLGREYALTLPVVVSFLEGRAVEMQVGAVRTVRDYFTVVAERQRLWLEQTLLGDAPDMEALRGVLADDPALADELIGQMQLALLTAAVKWGLPLDFTEPSIDGLDQLLGELHGAERDALPADRPTSEQLQIMATLWGVYLGEVLRRHHGGRWSASEVPGQGAVLRLQAGPLTIFPLSKVMKRIRNGAENAIDVYYRATIQLMRSGAPRDQDLRRTLPSKGTLPS